MIKMIHAATLFSPEAGKRGRKFCWPTFLTLEPADYYSSRLSCLRVASDTLVSLKLFFHISLSQSGLMLAVPDALVAAEDQESLVELHRSFTASTAVTGEKGGVSHSTWPR
jgi:hypothetical protein